MIDIKTVNQEVCVSSTGRLKIEVASSEYVPQIYALAQTYNLRKMTSEQIEKLGFLMSNFSEKDYREFVIRADYFYILLENSNLLGFLYAYSNNHVRHDDWLNLYIESKYPEPFVIIKQICIRPDLIGRGYATSLYQHLFSQVQECPFFAAIALEPLNHRSILFHERHGFRKVFQATPPDGISRGVWMRSPQPNGRRSNEYEQ